MSKDMYIYLTILGMSIVTFIPRVFPLLFFSRFKMHPELYRFINYFPISILTTLVMKEIFMTETGVNITWNNPNLIPGLITLLISMKYKSIGVSITIGIISYILVNMIF